MAIKLQMNVPQVFELAFPDGLRVNSKFGGDQVMFSLTNGERWYCDPFIASKITSAGIGANTPFTVTKREVINGNRRVVEYEVERILEQSLAAPAPPVAEVRPTVRAAESADAKTTAVFLGAGASVNAPAAVNMVDVAARALGVAATPAPAPSSVALMKMAGIGAVDAVLEIEAYAKSRGLTDFEFGVDNIQRLTACLFIEMNKKAGRA
jgi:hypothetical protein